MAGGLYDGIGVVHGQSRDRLVLSVFWFVLPARHPSRRPSPYEALRHAGRPTRITRASSGLIQHLNARLGCTALSPAAIHSTCLPCPAPPACDMPHRGRGRAPCHAFAISGTLQMMSPSLISRAPARRGSAPFPTPETHVEGLAELMGMPGRCRARLEVHHACPQPRP